MSGLLARVLGGSRPGFSFARLLAEVPGLARAFLWRANPLPAGLPDPPWLHLGCGENVLEGFANVDFLPHDARVTAWDLLDAWPPAWPAPVAGAFSEDTLEHFFLAEQLHILCEMNLALADGAVFRVLMPSYARLAEYCRDFEPRAGEFLHASFGVETEADALNMGLRFSGHRWLHDDRSLAHLAALAGFEAVKTTCAQSTVPFLSNRNLRTEEGTTSFAHDLVKRRRLRRLVVPPSALVSIDGLEEIEGIGVGEIRGPGARVRYQLPAALPRGAIASVNARGSNLSSFSEHSLKRLVLRTAAGEGAWKLDETLKSRPCMNLAMPAAIRLALAGREGAIEGIDLEPGAAGDRITIGPLEVFYFEPSPG